MPGHEKRTLRDRLAEATGPLPIPRVGPLFAWVNLFARPDPADGARVAGYRLVRGDDGQLYAISEPDATTPRASDD